MDDATAWPTGWSLVRGYFSPATLFLLLNVVIGTIALTSRSSHRRHHGHHDDDDDDERYKATQHQHNHEYAPPPPPAPLARTSSVMERLRSLGLYRFRSGDFPPEYNLSAAICDESEKQQAQYTRSRSEPAARTAPVSVEQRAKAAPAARAKAAVKKSTTEVRKLEQRAPAQARQVAQRAAPPRARPARAIVQTAAPVAAREEETAAAEGKLATATSVDARADDFINKFREQLQLQRLNSLINYKEMLNRGT
uniref:DUF4408 domain-containing protein n=1 Tax=Leersia perrieri TaxID=77586 RepID=A0A0D9V4T8_9ORYZ